MSVLLRRTLGENLDVEIVGGAGLWRVETDRVQLETTLLNLAVNARDAMPQGGKLTIETGNASLDEAYCAAHADVTPGQYALLAVTDTGSGMQREVLDRAFEPFFTTKQPGQGTGLGLSQVYGFVKQSGGHVKIYSEPGQGATVKIYLPRAYAAREDDAKPDEPPLRPGGDETVLIVEDDDEVRSNVIETLSELGYRPTGARDFDDAMLALSRTGSGFDLLLTDVVLPGRNGREVAAEIRLRFPATRVLFMTGYSRNAIMHQGRLDPDVAMIQKPFSQADLARKIASVLR
jgi:CheY-like chemotaxis protein